MKDLASGFAPRPSKKKRKTGKTKYVVGSIILLVLVACLVIFSTRRGQVKKVRHVVPSSADKLRAKPPISKISPLVRSVVAKGRLYVNAEPPVARIRVLNIRRRYRDGMALKKGRYHIEVSCPGHTTIKKWVEVQAGKDNTFSFRLARLLTTGTLLVRSEPFEAEWYFDGDYVGTTPDIKEDVEQGTHRIRVRKEGYEEWGTTINVRLGQRVLVRAELTKVSPKPAGIWLEPVTGMEFVWVPDGCFEMGSPADEAGRDSDEGLVHEVCVDGFWMGRTEVTNAQYRRFRSDHNSRSYNGQSLSGDDQPVVNVSWHDAKDFAEWLTQQSTGLYSFRLSSEAEWEYACRAGTVTARFWGDNADEACQYANVHDRTSQRINKFEWQYHDCYDGYAVTAPVGSFRPNGFGLYDMLGNVWEWCEDSYAEDAYSRHQRNNPINTGSGSIFVNRGGSWSDVPRAVRCAIRDRLDPEFKNSYVGFRVVRTP